LTSDVFQRLSCFGRQIVLLTFYMEERRLTEDAKSWVFTQFVSGIFPRSPLGSSCNAPNAFPNMFAPGRLQSISASVSASTSHFYDVLSILRFTKLRSIYAFSGWQANKKEIEEARQHLATHMHDDISNARRCLIHAGAVFGSLRSGTQYGYCDPFCLLIATLYILAYVEFIIHKQKQNLNHISIGQQSIYTLCIDKHAAGSFAQSWLRKECHAQLRLGGVGLLDDRSSRIRLMNESCRILTSQIRSCLSAGIAAAFADILSQWPDVRKRLYADIE